MYRPLPPYLIIKPSSGAGLGLFDTEPIKTSTNCGISHVSDRFMQNRYIRTPLGGFYNHSTTPNCKTQQEGRFLYLTTITDIKEGEELTSTYTLYDPS